MDIEQSPSKTASDTARALLFGLLALHNNFISRDALLAGFNTWLADKSRHLGSILLEAGALDGTRHALLESLVTEHLKMHGGDSNASVGEQPVDRSIRKLLEAQDDPRLEASLEKLGTAEPREAMDLITTLTAAASGMVGHRYRVVRPHAKGGLGEVFVAVDAELNREVALKEILEHHAFDAGSRARFLLEAQITGGLEHPGIVPVYGLGTYADGRPYYAMRFIRGDSLKGAIAAFHADSELKADQGKRALELTKLLRRFLDVCNAIDYAHSRGVLHRDIKPANIVMGKHGETLVVDWGLAKALGRTEQDVQGDEKPLAPLPAGGTAETLPGSALGTPAYMSPEQAAGDLDRIGPRSDVYCLGATLFCLLTGKAPFDGNDAGSILRRVQKGDFPRPQVISPGIDRALEAICLKAMALKREDRYESCRALADDVERWTAGEPVSAWREPLQVRAQRWMRRHRTAMIGAAATVLAGLVGLIGIAAVQARSNQDLRKAKGEVEAALAAETKAKGETEAALAAETKAKGETEAALKLSEEERERKQAVLSFLKDDVLATTRPEGQAGGVDKDVTLRKVIARAEPRIASVFKDQPIDEAEIRNTLGETAFFLSDFPLAIRHLERALELRQTRLGPDHPDTLLSRNDLAVAYRESGQLDRAIPLLEQVVETRRAKLGADHRDTLFAMNNLAGAYMRAGQLKRAIPLFEQTVNAQRGALGDDHCDTLGTMNNLALAYNDAGRYDRSIPLLEQAIEAQSAKVKEDHPETLTLLYNLALAYQHTGQLDRTIPLYEQVLKGFRAKLDPDDPGTLLTMVGLAAAYRQKGRLDRAIPLLEQAVKGFRAKLGDDHSQTLVAVGNLAQAYQAGGQLDRAISLHEQTLEAFRAKLGDDHTDTLIAMNNLAWAYEIAGQLDRAIRLYEQTVKIRQTKFDKDHPDALTTMDNLARAYATVGRLDRAIALREQVLDARRVKLGADNPATLRSMIDLAAAHAMAGRLDRCVPLFEHVIKTQEAKLGAAHPDTLASIHYLATAFELRGRWPEAERLRRDLLARRRTTSRPDDPLLAIDLAQLALDLLKESKWADAETMLRECLTIRARAIPDDWSHFNTQSALGEAVMRQGRYAEAEPLVVQGYEGLNARKGVLPPAARPRLIEAGDRLLRLYEAWGKPAKTRQWKAKLGLAELPTNVFAPGEDG